MFDQVCAGRGGESSPSLSGARKPKFPCARNEIVTQSYCTGSFLARRTEQAPFWGFA